MKNLNNLEKTEKVVRFIIKHYKPISIVILLMTCFITITNITKRCVKNISETFDIDISISTEGSMAIGLFATVAVALLIFALYYSYKKTKGKEIEGIKIKEKDGSFGTANWLTEKEAKNVLGIGTRRGIILGEKNNQMITLPDNSFLNKNIAVIGASRKYENKSICKTKYITISK